MLKRKSFLLYFFIFIIRKRTKIWYEKYLNNNLSMKHDPLIVLINVLFIIYIFASLHFSF